MDIRSELALVYRFYTDEQLSPLVKKDVSRFHEGWKKMRRPVETKRISRAEIMYGDGGIYADLDIECSLYALSPGALLVEPGYFAAGGAPSDLKPIDGRGLLRGQIIMMSPPKDAFWLDLMQVNLAFSSSPSQLVFSSAAHHR